MRRLVARVAIGLFILGGAWLVGRILRPLMGITGYVLTLITFMIIGYYLKRWLDRGQTEQVKPPLIPNQPAYPQPQQELPSLNPQTKTRYTPQQVRDMLQKIEQRYNAKEIDKGSYEQSLRELVYADAYGQWWTVNNKTGKWVQHKDGAWIEAEPPPWLEK